MDERFWSARAALVLSLREPDDEFRGRIGTNLSNSQVKWTP